MGQRFPSLFGNDPGYQPGACVSLTQSHPGPRPPLDSRYSISTIPHRFSYILFRHFLTSAYQQFPLLHSIIRKPRTLFENFLGTTMVTTAVPLFFPGFDTLITLALQTLSPQRSRAHTMDPVSGKGRYS